MGEGGQQLAFGHIKSEMHSRHPNRHVNSLLGIQVCSSGQRPGLEFCLSC